MKKPAEPLFYCDTCQVGSDTEYCWKCGRDLDDPMVKEERMKTKARKNRKSARRSRRTITTNLVAQENARLKEEAIELRTKAALLDNFVDGIWEQIKKRVYDEIEQEVGMALDDVHISR